MARYTLPGNIRAYWLTSAPSDLDAPTAAEIGAGTDLRGTKGGEALASLDGWKPSPNVFDTPDYVDNVVGNVAGDVTYPQSSMSFYADDADQTIKTALASGNQGYVVLGYEGSATGKDSEVFSATVQSNDRDPARGQAAMYTVNFAISAPTHGTFAA